MFPKKISVSGQYSMDIAWTNAGKAPAFNVRMTAEYSTRQPVPLFKLGCDRLIRNLDTEWYVRGDLVLPGESFDGAFDKVPPDWVNTVAVPPSLPTLGVHGCIWYTDVLTNQQRSTEFCFTVMKPDGPHSGWGPVPCSELPPPYRHYRWIPEFLFK
jgi:hypothetical protein